jgi:VRR-NUC domain-containing protein
MSRGRNNWNEAELLRILRQPDYGIANESTPPIIIDTPEKALLAEVRRLAKAHGWVCYHTHDSRHSDSGFPDLVLARTATATSPGRLIFAELKRAKTKTTQAQDTWLSVLAHTIPGVEVYLWRPADLDTITEILTARIGRIDALSLD